MTDDKWDTTMRLREVWSVPHRMTHNGHETVVALPQFVRIEQLYRHRFNGESEWRAIERVNEDEA